MSPIDQHTVCSLRAPLTSRSDGAARPNWQGACMSVWESGHCAHPARGGSRLGPSISIPPLGLQTEVPGF